MVKKAKQSKQADFQLGDVVAAKVKGFSIWPGTIVEVKSNGKKKQYTVKFFYTLESASSFQVLKPIDQMTASERNSKATCFRQAMEACENYIRQRPIRKSDEELKVDGSPKDCSLNDLTSEQANADRGNKQTINKSTPMQATKRELTLAKLKKKIDTKLEEKKRKKEAFKQQKSFEKASKGLPTLKRKFEPLSQWSDRLHRHINDTKAAYQVKSSIKECEKYLESLAKCLKLMHSDYGAQQKECFDFHNSLRQIVLTLKDIKRETTLPVSQDCGEFLNKLRGTDGIKVFMNEMKFPLYSDTVTERKENSKVERKRSVR